MKRKDRMIREYEKFSVANYYIIGFEYNGLVYAVEVDRIPRKFCRVQKECSKIGGYGLYLNVNTKKAKEDLLRKAYAVGTIEDLQGNYNRGVMFEKLIADRNGIEWGGKDNRRFYQAGDININGKEVQVKYQHARICYNSTLKRLAV